MMPVIHSPADPRVLGAHPPRPLATLLVPNAVNPYSRAIRVARTLAELGCDVTIEAIAQSGLPSEAELMPGVRLFRRGEPDASLARKPGGGRLSRRIRRFQRSVRELARWPAQDLEWRRALRTQAEPADLYHAFGYRAIPVALELARRAREEGRAGRVIYDVIDSVLDSPRYHDLGRLTLGWLWHLERWRSHAADAVVTVNEPLAEHLRRRLRMRTSPTTLLNAPPLQEQSAECDSDPFGLTARSPGARVILWIGRIVEDRGLREAVNALVDLPGHALVVLNAGGRPLEQIVTIDPRCRDRVIVIPPVPPDDVPRVVACADVTIIPAPGDSLNHRLSTPNKFWESLAGGTPVIVDRSLGVMGDIVVREGLGAVFDRTDPGGLAQAIRTITASDAEVAEGRRQRIRAVVASRGYHWDAGALAYRHLVERLIPLPPSSR